MSLSSTVTVQTVSTAADALKITIIRMSLKTTSRLPFSNPTIYGLLIMSGLSLTAFIAVESWVVQPVLPLGLLAHRTSGFVALNNLIIAILSFAVLYNVPLVRFASVCCLVARLWR